MSFLFIASRLCMYVDALGFSHQYLDERQVSSRAATKTWSRNSTDAMSLASTSRREMSGTTGSVTPGRGSRRGDAAIRTLSPPMPGDTASGPTQVSARISCDMLVRC